MTSYGQESMEKGKGWIGTTLQPPDSGILREDQRAVGQVEQRVNELKDMAQIIRKLTEELMQRFSPVIRGMHGEESLNKVPAPATEVVALAGEMDEILSGMRQTRRVMEEILEKCEL